MLGENEISITIFIVKTLRPIIDIINILPRIKINSDILIFGIELLNENEGMDILSFN